MPALKIKLTTYQPEVIELLKKNNSDTVITAVTYTKSELSKFLNSSSKIVKTQIASKFRLIELEKLFKAGCEIEGGAPGWMLDEMHENGREGNWRIEELYEGVPGYPVSKADFEEI
jgi:hypothetical protein